MAICLKKHVFSKVHGGTTPLFFWRRGSNFCFEVDITPCRLTKVKWHIFFWFTLPTFFGDLKKNPGAFCTWMFFRTFFLT